MSNKKPDPFLADKDNPEWTAEDFARAKPVKDVDPDIVEGMKRLRGQRGPQKAPTKSQVTLRLDPEIVSHFKAGGHGWQTRLNDALRDAIEKGRA